MKAWASRDRYVPDTNLRAWLHTILRNTFLSDIRKQRREIEDIDGKLAGRLSEPPPQEHAVALSELLSAMSTLPAPQREALTLVGAAGFTEEEAADRLGCAVGTIKSRVWRARTALSGLLQPEHADRTARHPGRPVIGAAMRDLSRRFITQSSMAGSVPAHDQGSSGDVAGDCRSKVSVERTAYDPIYQDSFHPHLRVSRSRRVHV